MANTLVATNTNAKTNVMVTKIVAESIQKEEQLCHSEGSSEVDDVGAPDRTLPSSSSNSHNNENTDDDGANMVPPPTPALRSPAISAGAILSKGQKPPAMSGCSLDFLYEQGYTKGLIKALERNKSKFPLRIWIVDNSSSMWKRDGHRIHESVSGRKNVEFVQCTRWEEMQQTIDYHAQMAAILKSTTIFRMLNDPVGEKDGSGLKQQFAIAKPPADVTDSVVHTYHDLEQAQRTVRGTKPHGCTPLTDCLKEIRENIIALQPKLREHGKHTRIVIVLATDGIPTDRTGKVTDESRNEFAETLISLKSLPVWVVVRLCTDDTDIVHYWNNLDVVGFDMEVIDDFVSEATEVYAKNKWINYALPLHRMREMGFHDDVFDVLDERTFTQMEIYDFCKILFGPSVMKKGPQPTPDNWLTDFCPFLETICNKEKHQWNPMNQKVEPWLNVTFLKQMFDHDGNLKPDAVLASPSKSKKWFRKLLPTR